MYVCMYVKEGFKSYLGYLKGISRASQSNVIESRMSRKKIGKRPFVWRIESSPNIATVCDGR